SCKGSSQQLQKHTSLPSAPLTFKATSQPLPSMTPTSISSFEGVSVYMEKENVILGYPSQPTSSSVSSEKSTMTAMDSTSKLPCAWHLPDSYELENLRGKPGTIYCPNLISQENISPSMQMDQSLSFFPSSKQIHTAKAQQFISLKQTPHYALS